MSLLTVPVRPAQSGRLGTVLTNTTGTESPVVYRVEETDDLLAGKASVEALDATNDLATAAQASASAAVAVADEASTDAAIAASTSQVAQEIAEAAQLAADAAIAAADSFPKTDFRGTITALGDDPGAAASYAGKWWQIRVAGTLAHVNAGSLVVEDGDKIISDGSVWNRYGKPPTFLPDGSVLATKLEPIIRNLLLNEEDDGAGIIRAWVDAEAKRLMFIATNGELHAKLALDVEVANGLTATFDHASHRMQLSLGTEAGKLPIGDGGSIDSTVDSEWLLWAIVDEEDRVLMSISEDGTVSGKFAVAEVVAARGGWDTLSEKLGVHLDSWGAPQLEHHNAHTLRDWRRLVMQLRLGEAVQPKVAIFGDSWIQGYEFTPNLATRLRSYYGNAGAGFLGISPTTLGSIPVTAVNGEGSRVLTGTWDSVSAYDREGPDLAGTQSSTPGSLITITIAAGAASTAVVLYRRTPGAGSFRWRVDGGSWTTQSADGAAAIVGLSITVSLSGSTVELEIVSGTTRFYGCDLRTVSAGVRVHRIGHAGARWTHFEDAPASRWEEGVAILDPDLAIVVLGTNDQSSGVTPEDAADAATTMITRLRTVKAGMDILIVQPPENLGGYSTTMASIRDAIVQVAYTHKTALVDGVRLFGAVSEYGDGTPRELFLSTGPGGTRHLTPNGDALLSESVMRLLFTP